MTTGTVRIEGLRELDKKLSRLGVKVGSRILMKVTRRAVKPVRIAIKSAAPVGTETRVIDGKTITPGFLRSRVKVKVRRLNTKSGGDGVIRARIGVFKVPYVGAVEYGARGIPAQPFIRPAWRATRGEALRIFIKELPIEIEKEALKK